MPHDSRCPPLLARLRRYSYIHEQGRSSCGPPATIEEVELRVILYPRSVQEAVCGQGFTHFVEVESEVSMTSQKLRRVETGLPMLFLSPQPNMFDQHRGSEPSVFSFQALCRFVTFCFAIYLLTCFSTMRSLAKRSMSQRSP